MSSAPSAGQKVTKDPQANNRINEGVGVVTSDSLAAESLTSGGHFAQGNPHAAPMNQPSKSTTTNNTNVSAATKLEAAPNSELRDNDTDGPEIINDKPNSNTHSSDSHKQSLASTAPSNQTSNVAPTATYEIDGSGAVSKVHGKNLKGGDDADIRGDEANASFNSEVGTEDDPGRGAVEGFRYRNAGNGGVGGKGVGEGGMYDGLRREERA